MRKPKASYAFSGFPCTTHTIGRVLSFGPNLCVSFCSTRSPKMAKRLSLWFSFNASKKESSTKDTFLEGLSCQDLDYWITWRWPRWSFLRLCCCC